jgi:hypothetical protein
MAAENVRIGYFDTQTYNTNQVPGQPENYDSHAWIGIIIRNEGPLGKRPPGGAVGRSIIIYDCDANGNRPFIDEEKGNFRKWYDVLSKSQKQFVGEVEKLYGSRGRKSKVKKFFIKWPEKSLSNKLLCAPLAWTFSQGFMKYPATPLQENDPRVDPIEFACFEKA